MTAPGGSGAEAAARAHAGRLLARDVRARDDLVPGASVEPPDLLERLLAGGFHAFELVAHARIGAHHILKTKLVGPVTLVVQARWAADADGAWRIREVELVRIEDPGVVAGVAGWDPEPSGERPTGART